LTVFCSFGLQAVIFTVMQRWISGEALGLAVPLELRAEAAVFFRTLLLASTSRSAVSFSLFFFFFFEKYYIVSDTVFVFFNRLPDICPLRFADVPCALSNGAGSFHDCVGAGPRAVETAVQGVSRRTPAGCTLLQHAAAHFFSGDFAHGLNLWKMSPSQPFF
jgi:hypothetical protein